MRNDDMADPSRRVIYPFFTVPRGPRHRTRFPEEDS